MNLRSYLPEPIRICGRAYFTGAARDFRDWIGGRQRNPYVPPARFNTNGNGDYVKVGDSWARRFEEIGLARGHHVLEVGCGTGRIARALIGKAGSYTGYDVLRSAVEWAARAFRRRQAFAFHHLDVFNDMYNPRGREVGDWIKFGEDFDFAYATSLFSHLDPDVAAIYLAKIRRGLKPGGSFVSTWYAYDADTLARNGNRYALAHDLGHFRRESLSNPALVVAYDEGWLREAFARAGFASFEIRRGAWRGGEYAGQDVVIAK